MSITFEQLKDHGFNCCITTVDLADMQIPLSYEEHPPANEKIERHLHDSEFSPIVITNDYWLLDGYITYIILKRRMFDAAEVIMLDTYFGSGECKRFCAFSRHFPRAIADGRYHAASLPKVDLPGSLWSNIPQLTKLVHDDWCAQRFRNGWTCGRELSIENKTHSDLLPFHLLPNERRTAKINHVSNVYRAALKYGFNIIDGGSDVEQ